VRGMASALEQLATREPAAQSEADFVPEESAGPARSAGAQARKARGIEKF